MTNEDLFENSLPDGLNALHDLALLGLDEVVYVRSLSAEAASGFFPDIPHLPDAPPLFAAFAADGTPMFISASRSAILAEAMERDLMVASLH